MGSLSIALVALAVLTPRGAAAGTDMAASSAAVGAHGEQLVDVLAQEMSRNSRRLMGVNDTRPPAWHGRFDPTYGLSYFSSAIAYNKCDPSSENCNAIPGLTYPYYQIVTDPTNTSSNQPVMKVNYPAKGWAANSATPSGILFYAYPFKHDPKETSTGHISAGSATLAYDVYFPPNFDFVKGGKLPGLAGGASNGRGCGGGADPAWCFSFRIMWRTHGMGEAYLYVPHYMQGSDFCSFFPGCDSNTKSNCTVCDYQAGVSFGRGSFYFQAGQWNRIYMKLVLNNANQTNGGIEVRHNDKVVIKYGRMNWRQTGDSNVEGVEMASWFGGGDSSWGPKSDTYTLLRNFRMWRDDPPRPPAAAGRSAAAPRPQPQGVLVEKILAGE